MKKLFNLSYVNLVGFVMVLCTVAFLVYVNSHAKALEQEINSINRQIKAEHLRIEMLKKNWAYLTAPRRIMELSQKYLPHLAKIKPEQIYPQERFIAQFGQEAIEKRVQAMKDNSI